MQLSLHLLEGVRVDDGRNRISMTSVSAFFLRVLDEV